MKRRQLLASIPFIASGTVIDRIGRAALPLRVGAALPDPPFEFITGNGPAGFDIALMQRIAERLGRQWQLVPYEGADFNGIFAGLDDGTYDCVASGTTITPERERIVDFCAPYVVSGQSLVVDPNRHPNVHGIDDLQGLVIGVQEGTRVSRSPTGWLRSIGPRASASTPMMKSSRRLAISRPAAAMCS